MHKKDIKYLLDIILTNAFSHMQTLEREIASLNLKRDGTDKAEDMHRARLLTLVLTLVNDTVHPGHDYAKLLFGSMDPKGGFDASIERYKQNQKMAFENKLVNDCHCKSCELHKSLENKKAEVV